MERNDDALDFYAAKIQWIALSRIRQIEDGWKAAPQAYKKDTGEYCDAMYDIIDNLPEARLTDTVKKLHDSYAEVGMEDDGYIADSLMTLALAAYQNEIGERNVYEMGWNQVVEAFFRTVAV